MQPAMPPAASSRIGCWGSQPVRCVADPLSSKACRKAWEMNGLAGRARSPLESWPRAQASQADAGTSAMRCTTRTTAPSSSFGERCSISPIRLRLDSFKNYGVGEDLRERLLVVRAHRPCEQRQVEDIARDPGRKGRQSPDIVGDEVGPRDDRGE